MQLVCIRGLKQLVILVVKQRIQDATRMHRGIETSLSQKRTVVDTRMQLLCIGGLKFPILKKESGNFHKILDCPFSFGYI